MEYTIAALVVLLALLVGQIFRYMNITDAQDEIIRELQNELRAFRDLNE